MFEYKTVCHPYTFANQYKYDLIPNIYGDDQILDKCLNQEEFKGWDLCFSYFLPGVDKPSGLEEVTIGYLFFIFKREILIQEDPSPDELLEYKRKRINRIARLQIQFSKKEEVTYFRTRVLKNEKDRDMFVSLLFEGIEVGVLNGEKID